MWNDAKYKGDGQHNGNGKFHRPDPKPTRVKATFTSAEDAIEGATPRGGKLAGAWKYPRDEMRIARFNMPDAGKEFRPVHPVANGWAIGDPPAPLPLYRGDELPADRPIVVVEGEKCADLAREIGFAAVTSAHGSNAPAKSDWKPLAGREVWIFPDADDVGEKYARTVAGFLTGEEYDLRCSVKIVHLPNLPPGGDIVDFNRDFVETPEATRAEIVRLAEATPFEKSPDPPKPQSDEADAEESPKPPDPDALVFSPGDPLPMARAFRFTRFHGVEGSTLYFGDGVFKHHNATHYVGLAEDAMRSSMYAFLEPAQKWVKREKEMQLVRFAPNAASVSGAIDALKAVSYTSATAPWWLSDDARLPPASEVMAMRNGLVRLRVDGPPELFRPPTPLWFSPNAVDYDFIADTGTPDEWLKFLDVLWPDDRESIELLQEWMGYLLTIDNRQEKILMTLGPTRSGKGMIARVVRRLIGTANACAPTLAGLTQNFGLVSLIGQLVAIVSDARLSGRTDQSIIVERLLAISGEDAVDVERKFLPPVTMHFPPRFWIMTNEMPRLIDASGALPNRFLVLKLTKSFLGREDTTLTDKLVKELPGILLWAIKGWKRLRKRGKFIQPDTAKDAADEMKDLASPISAFIRDFCVVGAKHKCKVSDLFDGWRAWCGEQGRAQTTNAQSFGRDLRSAMPEITTKQFADPEKIGEMARFYLEINLTACAAETMRLSRSKRTNALVSIARVSREKTQ